MPKTGRMALLLAAIAALSIAGAPAQAEDPSAGGCVSDDDCFAILRCSDRECSLSVVHLFLHLDKYLKRITAAFGVWTYIILFLIIFCETGLVVTPVLPGDSLLFATGALTAIGALDVWWCFGLLSAAAILGDTVNYWIGHAVGPKVFSSETSRFLNKEHLNRTHAFYERHGGKTIIIARFMPFIRTFAPFVAGIGAMTYPRFIAYNVIGGLAWISSFVFGGYFFGNIPVVKRNFTIVIFTIIFISILPGIIEFIRARRRKVVESGGPGV